MDLKQYGQQLISRSHGVWVVFALMCVLLIWTLLAFISGIGRALAPVPTLSGVTNLALSVPTDLANQSLFGQYEQAQTHLPALSAGLTLQGVVTDPSSPTSAHAMALVSGSGGQVKTYHVGDALPGGATILKILPNMAVVNYGGQEQALRLPVPKLGNS